MIGIGTAPFEDAEYLGKSPPATGLASYNVTVFGGLYEIALRGKPDSGNSVWVQIAYRQDGAQVDVIVIMGVE